MDEIIKIALKSKGFGEDLIPGILTVAKASGNVEVAIQHILGIYETPKIPKYSEIRNKAVFVRYDPFLDRVDFIYLHPCTKGAYFPKDIDKESITLENMYELAIGADNLKDIEDKVYHSIPTGKYDERTYHCTLNQWIDRADKDGLDTDIFK